jgi:mannosyltransferase OCH1-like enzyme
VSGFPRLLHQTWKSTELSPPLDRFESSWQRRNRWLERRFYDDDDCRRFIRTEYPQYLDIYDSFGFGVQRADFFRYLVVYHHGGLYADVDMECLKPLHTFFELDGAIFCVEGYLTRTRQTELAYRHPFQIANCVFIAEPRHPFLLRLVQTVASLALSHPSATAAGIENVTGPPVLTRLVFDGAPQVRILDQIFWMPPLNYPDVAPFNRNMYMRHHFVGSWKDDTLRRRGIKRRWVERWRLPNPFPGRAFLSFTESTAPTR